jgi:hypothetical protein
MYDKDTGEITRPDIPAVLGSSPGDGDVRASGFHPRQERELLPYTAMPVLPSRLNEPTVPDAALKMSMARAEVQGDHTPSDAGRVPRSGPRHEVPSAAPPPEALSTVPPPGRKRSRRSLRPEGTHERASLPPDSSRARPSLVPDSSRAKKSAPADNAFGRTTAKATPAALREAPHPSLFHASLLVVGTALGAAGIGVGLGNGSIARLFSPAPPVDVPHAAPPAPRPAPPRATRAPVAAPAVAAAAPRAVVADEAPKVPVLRIEELPPGEVSAASEPAPAPKASAKATPKPAHKAHH